MSPASRAVAAAILAATIAGCGEDEAAVPVESVVTSLPTLAEWCERFEQDLPAMASPNPDGQELEVLDLHIARAREVAAGAPGVSNAATEAAGKAADFYVEVRQRVADGEELPDVLKELWSTDKINDLIEPAEVLDAEAEKLC
jgi:hypothetical protein